MPAESPVSGREDLSSSLRSDLYTARRDRFAAEERALARRSLRFSIARFVAALGLAASLVAIVAFASEPWRLGGPFAGAGASLVLFLALLGLHDRVIRAERRAHEMVGIQQEALARIARRWDDLPVPAAPAVSADSPLARDLGLFGRASLFQLLSTVRTPPGRSTLAGWLLAPAPPREIRARQAAVRELAADLELRQALELSARTMAAASPDVEPFLAWAEGEPWLRSRPWLLALARVLALVTLGSIGLVGAGVLPFSVWSILPFVNFVLSYAFARHVHAAFDRVGARERDFGSYAELFAQLEGRSFAAPKLRALVERMSADGVSAHRQIDLLKRRLALIDVRHSAPIHFVLQSLTLWDLHLLALLERWQLAAGRRARGWLAALGELEALAAFGALAHDEPDWTDAEIVAGNVEGQAQSDEAKPQSDEAKPQSDGANPQRDEAKPPRFEAEALGHPLLAAGERVCNDVALGPPGRFLLVTGSNMSGKSTLLRAIGLDAVLALAGAPVCARKLTISPLALGTSVLVEDSLASGVSFFYAELKRVRAIVDQAEAARRDGGALLFLLDEILRGTNSAERQIAVAEILRRLLDLGAIGAVSTHDLELASLPALADAAHTVHFRESFTDGPEPRMTFDYHLRDGVAPTTNALKLLAMVGLRSA